MFRLTAAWVTSNSFAARVKLRCRAAASKATRLFAGGNLVRRDAMTKTDALINIYAVYGGLKMSANSIANRTRRHGGPVKGCPVGLNSAVEQDDDSIEEFGNMGGYAR